MTRIVLVLLIAAVLLCVKAAGTEDPASHESAAEGNERRNISLVSQTANNVEFKSEHGSNNFDFKTDITSNSPRLTVKFETDSSTEYSTEVRFVSLVEFTNAGASGFNVNEDTVVKTIDYQQSGSWGAYSAPVKNNATGVWSYSISHNESGGATTTVTFYFAEQVFSASGNVVPATAVKFDYSVSGYSYAQANTDLALHATVKYEADDDISEHNGGASADDAIIVRNAASSNSVFFQWATALTTPSNAAVIASSPAGTAGSENDMYFTFDVSAAHANPATIVWDPIFGVSSSVTLVATVLLIAGLALVVSLL